MTLMLHAELPDQQQGFCHDVPAHLRFAGAAVLEGNGNLDDTHSFVVTAVRDLDLEGVSSRMDGREVQFEQRAATEALESRCKVA